jgi:hypothetical protein
MIRCRATRRDRVVRDDRFWDWGQSAMNRKSHTRVHLSAGAPGPAPGHRIARESRKNAEVTSSLYFLAMDYIVSS